MKKCGLFALGTLCFSFNLQADDESFSHFPAKPSPDVATALCHLQHYNQVMAQLLAKQEITSLDMVKVHEISYTLENALKRLDSTLDEAAEELEKAHKASEKLHAEQVRTSGKKYLKAVASMLKTSHCKQ